MTNVTKLIKKAKGITGGTLRTLRFEDYYNCLFNQNIIHRKKYIFQSKKHQVYTVKQGKIALSPYAEKRIIYYILTDTPPWGWNFDQC